MNDSSLIRKWVERLPEPNALGAPARVALEDAKLRAVLGAARVAPSADNAQTWRFVTVQSDDTKLELANAVDATLAGALSKHAVVIAVCGIQWVVTRARREQPFVFMDVPIALTQMLLVAAELKLSCTWTLDVDEPAARAALSIPDDVRVVALVGLT